MADEPDPKAEASAEKAYATAAEAAPTELPAPTKPAEFSVKTKREAKAPAAAHMKPSLPKARKPAAKAKPVKRAVLPRPAAAKAKALPKASKTPKASKAKAPTPVKTSTAPQLKEKPMDKTADFVADAQAKAKKVFEKSTAMFGEYADFAKGNVEAFVESGKILATGIQEMGSSMLAEGKTVFETTAADAKQLAAAKSPSEFFKLHTDILRRNFDSTAALTSKNGEAVMKLASDSFAPISGRVSLAVEKLKQAA